MRYTFIFYKDSTEIFRGDLHQSKCEYCNTTTEYGFEYCKKHLLSEKHLVIGNSKNFPGEKALFASNGKEVSDNWRENEIVFHGPKPTSKSSFSTKGDHIIDYNGETLSKNDMNCRYGKDIHGINVYGPYCAKENSHIVDAACVRGVGSFCNHQPKYRANAELYGTKKLKIAASKHIRNGSEIEITYGYNPLSLNNHGFTYKTIKHKELFDLTK